MSGSKPLAKLLATLTDPPLPVADVVASLQRADVRVTFPPAPMVADVAAAPRTSKAQAPRGAAAAPAPPSDGSPGHRLALADLIAAGVLHPRTELSAEFRGQTITAKVLEGGDVELNVPPSAPMRPAWTRKRRSRRVCRFTWVAEFQQEPGQPPGSRSLLTSRPDSGNLRSGIGAPESGLWGHFR